MGEIPKNVSQSKTPETPKTSETKGERKIKLSSETMGEIRNYLSEYGNLCNKELEEIKKNPEEYAKKKGWPEGEIKGKIEERMKKLETISKDLSSVPKDINNLPKESLKWIGKMLNEYWKIEGGELNKSTNIAKMGIELIKVINNQPKLESLRKIFAEMEKLNEVYQNLPPEDQLKRLERSQQFSERNRKLWEEMGKIFELSPEEEKKAIEEIRKAGEEEKRKVPPEGEKPEEEKGKIPEEEKKPEVKTVRPKSGVEDYFSGLVEKNIAQIIREMGVREITGETQRTVTRYLKEIQIRNLADLAKQYAQQNSEEIVKNAENTPLSVLFKKENELLLIAAAQKSKEFMEMVKQNEEVQVLANLIEAWNKPGVSAFAIAPTLHLLEGKRREIESDLGESREDLLQHFRNIEKIEKSPVQLQEYQKLAEKVRKKQTELKNLEEAMKEMTQNITQTNLEDKNRSALLREMTSYAEGLRSSEVLMLISRGRELGLRIRLPREEGWWNKIFKPKEEPQFKVWDSLTGQWKIMSQTDLREELLRLYKGKRQVEMTREEITKTAQLSVEEMRAFNENLKHALIENWKREQLKKRIPSEKLKEFEKQIAEARGIDPKDGFNKTLENINQEEITGNLEKDAPQIQNWLKKNFGIDDISVEQIITRGDREAYGKAVEKDDIAVLVWLIKTILELATPISRGER